MHDIRAIRADPAAFDTALERRGLPLIALYEISIIAAKMVEPKPVEVMIAAILPLPWWEGAGGEGFVARGPLPPTPSHKGRGSHCSLPRSGLHHA